MESNYERALRVAGYLPNTREDRVKAMLRQAVECAEGRCSCEADAEALEAKLISYEDITMTPRQAKLRIEGEDIEAQERRDRRV